MAAVAMRAPAAVAAECRNIAAVRALRLRKINAQAAACGKRGTDVRPDFKPNRSFRSLPFAASDWPLFFSQ